MGETKKKRRMTKDELQFIVENWESNTYEQLSEKMSLTVAKIKNIAYILRGMGINLAIKKQENVYRDFVENYFREHGIVKKENSNPDRKKNKEVK